MFELIKAVGGFVIPLGTEAIITSVAANSVKNCGPFMKAAATISGLVIGWWVGDKAADYLDGELDRFKGKWDKYQIGGDHE